MKKSLVWFRQDLRLNDNPALHAAAQACDQILAVYIFDETKTVLKMGNRSLWWLEQSLKSLNHSLDNKLNIFKQSTVEQILKLIEEHQISEVFWNDCYQPWQRKLEEDLTLELAKKNIKTTCFNGSLLWEINETLKSDNTPYKVFTPFYKNLISNAKPPRAPLKAPKNIKFIKDKNALSITEISFGTHHASETKLKNIWEPGEAAAAKKLNFFIDENISSYQVQRDFPALAKTSRLSPHLHFGEISPNQVWHCALNFKPSSLAAKTNVETFLKELIWREFSYNLLYHNPNLYKDNFQPKFDNFPWKADKTLLKAWQNGETGYPFIDAGMRELLETGYMHNRVRMIVASFLVKNLLQPWQDGAAWFWEKLVDADLANNSASWQWVAGSGADAAPFFRIFNPITQAKKFDPDGEYIKKFVPELLSLPPKHLFSPWLATPAVLQQAKIKLGKTYPFPIIDLELSRKKALEYFKKL